jgi:uncharacterized membrane protein YfcA
MSQEIGRFLVESAATVALRDFENDNEHNHHHHHHKDFFPLESSDYLGLVCVVLGLMVAASGGIGGGGILVPILILVFGFSPKHAIPLSNFTILGSSITNVYMNMQKRHPLADRPLVSWDLIVIMEPLTMLGAVVGAYAGKVIPDEILVAMLVVVLGATAHRTVGKGIKQWAKESREQHLERNAMESALATADLEEEAEELTSLLNSDAGRNDEESRPGLGAITANKETTPARPLATAVGSDTSSSPMSGATSTDGQTAPSIADLSDPSLEKNALLERDKVTPINKVTTMSVMFVVVVILNLLKAESLGIVPCGGMAYWLFSILIIAWLVAIAARMRSELVAEHHAREAAQFPFVEGDVRWTERNTIIYPLICIIAGLFAGMFGIGGGIVKGPLMLEMGVHPLVAAASVAVMIFYTSVAATTSFIAFGTLTWDYGIALFVLGLIATWVGQTFVSYLVQRYQRVSLVSLSIGAVVTISTLLMAGHGVLTLLDPSEAGDDSNSIC